MEIYDNYRSRNCCSSKKLFYHYLQQWFQTDRICCNITDNLLTIYCKIFSLRGLFYYTIFFKFYLITFRRTVNGFVVKKIMTDFWLLNTSVQCIIFYSKTVNSTTKSEKFEFLDNNTIKNHTEFKYLPIISLRVILKLSK